MDYIAYKLKTKNGEMHLRPYKYSVSIFSLT